MRRAVHGLVAAFLAVAPAARADVTHIVQRGHTIEAIAHRYHVAVKAIAQANHLTDPAHLKPGQTLVIPGVDAARRRHGPGDKRGEGPAASAARGIESPADRARGGAAPARAATEHGPIAGLEPSPEPRGHLEGDTVNAERLGEDFHIHVRDARGHVPPSALRAFERMMRQGNGTHPVDPRLVALVGIVSNHFGGKTIEVVSGYRAYTPTQYTPHSNHNYGRALDFRVRGVKNEDVRDFCRTLRSAGCGYYPNGSFVHLDVRDTKAYWVDWSRAGEPPKYEKPGVAADEGTTDVPDDVVGATGERGELSAGSAATHAETDPEAASK